MSHTVSMRTRACYTTCGASAVSERALEPWHVRLGPQQLGAQQQRRELPVARAEPLVQPAGELGRHLPCTQACTGRRVSRRGGWVGVCAWRVSFGRTSSSRITYSRPFSCGVEELESCVEAEASTEPSTCGPPSGSPRNRASRAMLCASVAGSKRASDGSTSSCEGRKCRSQPCRCSAYIER